MLKLTLCFHDFVIVIVSKKTFRLRIQLFKDIFRYNLCYHQFNARLCLIYGYLYLDNCGLKKSP